MKLTNINGKKNIFEYVDDKLSRFGQESKSFQTLFSYMFSETDNVMAELTDGYRIKRCTYGECKQTILRASPTFASALSFLQKGELVGLYMENSVEWLQVFWSILRLGYKPLLMNLRLSNERLEGILQEYGVRAVISGGMQFATAKTLLFQDLLVETDGEAEADFAEEIYFMSSGTTETIKLCAYTAENFFYQIVDSGYIIQHCHPLITHYEGQLKLLALLPFYHVFGFIAVYLWFGFFSRTFVFLKDLRPQTLLSTIRKHKITHIFAVPLVWNTIHKEALRKIRAKGEKTFQTFQKGLATANGSAFGAMLTRRAFQEIRDNLFGESVQFMISGGSPVAAETLAFFNGIGYHLTNGYGMTEIGITSVELSRNRQLRNTASVGAPFPHTEYCIQEGELFVRGKAMASRILQGGKETIVEPTAWFSTNDLAREEHGHYYLLGRKDDLIVCRNGENLNPNQLESRLHIPESDSLCLFADETGRPVLLISVAGCFSAEKLQRVKQAATQALRAQKLEDEIQQIVLTCDRLIEEQDFKISRKKVAKKYAARQFRILTPETLAAQANELLSTLEEGVRACFAKALGKAPETIGLEANFFLDLGGSSLDYFTLADLIRSKYSVEVSAGDGRSLASVKEICEYLTSH